MPTTTPRIWRPTAEAEPRFARRRRRGRWAGLAGAVAAHGVPVMLAVWYGAHLFAPARVETSVGIVWVDAPEAVRAGGRPSMASTALPAEEPPPDDPTPAPIPPSAPPAPTLPPPPTVAPDPTATPPSLDPLAHAAEVAPPSPRRAPTAPTPRTRTPPTAASRPSTLDAPPPAPVSAVAAHASVAMAEGGEARPRGVREAARALTKVMPEFPAESRRRREEGDVSVAVDFAADGTVAALRIDRSSGYARLDRAALAAARRTKFAPPTSAGRPVAATQTVAYTFRLQ